MKPARTTTSLVSKKGFTLIETLVAIFILSVAVASALTLTQKSLQSAFFARDQIIATYLTQEAIEFIRNVRDVNYIRMNNGEVVNWLEDFQTANCVNTGASTAKHCQIDIVSGDIERCTGGSGATCEIMRFNEDTGLYGYDPDYESSKFRRDIVITENPVDQEASITVTITWLSGLVEYEFSVREHILNWAEVDPSAATGPGGEEGGEGEGGKGGEEGGEEEPPAEALPNPSWSQP